MDNADLTEAEKKRESPVILNSSGSEFFFLPKIFHTAFLSLANNSPA